MCRLLLLAGSDTTTFNYLLNALSEASECDPYLAELRGEGRCGSHDDGWGYALIGYRKGKALSRHYRSCVPVFEDPELDHLRSFVRELDFLLLIAHSRKASKGGVEVRNAHPFHYSHLGFDFWIAHNGTVNDRMIAEEKGWDYDEGISDTYYLGRYIYESLGELPALALKRASKFVREGSAMNTVSLASKGPEAMAMATCLYHARDEGYEKYYRLLEFREGSSFGVVSSTLSLYASLSFSELPNGKALIFKSNAEGSLSRELVGI